jgi:hypothetical protein
MKCCKTKFERIVEGWGNLAFKNPEIEKLATERAKICAVCLQNVNEWCQICGAIKCYIPAKVRSRTEICKGGLW